VKQYHIDLGPGDVSEYVLLPGDPGRVDKIGEFLEDFEIISFHREFKTGRGKYKGIDVTVTSTGIGGPSAAIALEELARIGARVFLRVGTCGAIQPDIEVGDLIIATGAVRLEGTSKQYVRVEYPAVASHPLVEALIRASKSLKLRHHVGIVDSTDSFYPGQERPGFRGYMPRFARGLIEELKSARVLAFEMEAATIFTLTNIYGLEGGMIAMALANRIKDVFQILPLDDLIKAALEGIRIYDEIREEYGR